MTEVRDWERWIQRQDDKALRWAAAYLAKHCGLIFLWNEAQQPNERRRDFLTAILAQDTHREWRGRVNDARRQENYLKRIGKNKARAVYILSKGAKQKLRVLARRNDKTVHAMLEELIKQAASASGIEEEPLPPAEQLSVLGDHNSTKLEGATTNPYPAQNLQRIDVSNQQLTQSKYVEPPNPIRSPGSNGLAEPAEPETPDTRNGNEVEEGSAPANETEEMNLEPPKIILKRRTSIRKTPDRSGEVTPTSETSVEAVQPEPD